SRRCLRRAPAPVFARRSALAHQCDSDYAENRRGCCRSAALGWLCARPFPNLPHPAKCRSIRADTFLRRGGEDRSGSSQVFAASTRIASFSHWLICLIVKPGIETMRQWANEAISSFVPESLAQIL